MNIKFDYLVLLGLLWQFFFFLRFLVQWFESEKNKKVVIPKIFWHFSVIWACIILVYSILRWDIVFILWTIFSMFIYIRNLVLGSWDDVLSTNHKKHKTKNPLKKYFINKFNNKIYDIVKSINFGNMIDVWCWEWFLLKKLKPLLYWKKVIWIDYEATAVEHAKSQNNEIEFFQWDVTKLNYQKDQFDLVICLEVLEHLENPNVWLQELLRVGNKHLILSVPNEPVFTIMRFLSLNNFFQLGKHPEHLNLWNAKSFEIFIRSNFDGKLTIYKSNPWIIAVLEK